MFRVINEYMNKVNITSNNTIKNVISNHLNNYEDIKKYSINVNFNQYVVDIKLKEYSIEKVEELFAKFNQEVSYSYSSLYVRFNEGRCVRYRYITSNENKDAFYCDIIYS